MILNFIYKQVQSLSKLRWCLFVVTAVILISFVILMGALRLALPYLVSYEDEVEKRLKDTLAHTVQISRIDADWHWFSPRIKLIDVSVNKKDKRSQLIRFDEVIFEFGIFTNLINFQFEPTVVTLKGAHLSVKRDKEGKFTVQDVTVKVFDNGAVNARSDNVSNRNIISFLKGKELQLQAMKVQWLDLMRSSKSMVFNDLNMAVQVEDNSYKLFVEAETAEDIGKKILLIAELEKKKPTGNWLSKVYIEASQVNLRYFSQYIDTTNFNLSSRLDTKLWLNLNGHELINVKGKVESSSLSISGKNGMSHKYWSTNKLSGNFQLEHNAEEWSLVVDDLNINIGERDWNDVYLSLQYNENNNALSLRSDYLDLSDVHQLIVNLPLRNALTDKLSSIKPKGILRKTDIHIDDWKKPNNWLLKTSFTDFGVGFSEQHVRIDGLSGELSLEKNKGQLLLDSMGVTLVSEYFNDALLMDKLKGSFNVERNNDDFTIESGNLLASIDSVAVYARLNLDIQKQILLDMQLQINGVDSNWLNQHRADGLLGKDLTKWFLTAVPEARFENVNLLFHGMLSDFPFERNDGVIQSEAKVSDGVLKYHADWPLIKDINARVFYDNKEVVVDAESGRIGNSLIKDTMTTVVLHGNEHVIVNGKIKSDQDGIDEFFRATPLSSDYNALTNYTRVDGDLNGDLTLDIPLADGVVDVAGRLYLQDNKLKIIDYGYEITGVEGVIDFNNSKITSNNLSGVFNEQPVSAVIKTVSKKTENKYWNNSILSAHFRSDVNAVIPFDIKVGHLFENKTDWDLELVFNPAASNIEALSLKLKTTLGGVNVLLPAPLSKKAGDSADFVLGLKLYSDHSELLVKYSDLLDLSMRWGSDAEVLRSDIRINNGVAVLPDQGISLSARVDQLDIKQWQDVVMPFVTLPNTKSALFEDVRLNLELKNVKYEHYQLSNVNMIALLRDELWNIAVDSNEMQGVVTLPEDFNNDKPVNIRFNKMNVSAFLSKSDTEKTKNNREKIILPNKIPPLNVAGKNLIYKDYKFDKMAMRTTKTPYGLTVQALDLKAESVALKLKGNWFVKNTGIEYSGFRIDVESRDVGEMLSSFGFTKSIKEGSGKAMINWQWDASPFDFDWNLVRGNMNVSVEDGRFVDIEPGAGRLLGVFSLSALPRRFMLDFSDTFTEGFEFNKFESIANFSKGQLYTTKTKIEGTLADIYFNGRIGLSDKDYDQTMSIVPRITSGVTGWLTVLQGAGVGLVAYIGQKLLGVDEAAQDRYHITGSWSEPKITKIDKKQTASSNERKANEQ